VTCRPFSRHVRHQASVGAKNDVERLFLASIPGITYNEPLCEIRPMSLRARKQFLLAA